MNSIELAKELESISTMSHAIGTAALRIIQLEKENTRLKQLKMDLEDKLGGKALTNIVRSQSDEITDLKRRLLEAISDKIYADRAAEVMCDLWQAATNELDSIKKSNSEK